MAEIHDQLQTEGIVKESFATMLKGRRGVIGRLYLTGDRLVFLQAPQFLLMFGALGAAFMGIAKPKKLAAEIPLSSITGIQRSKFGMNKNVLDIHTGDAEPLRFAVKFDEWAPVLESARPQATTAS